MTELEFKSDPRIIINEIHFVNEARFMAHSGTSLTQLEHIFVNTNRFVLLIYLIDWPEDQQAERDALLREVLETREQAESAFKQHRLEDSVKLAIWQSYWKCAQSLVDLCSTFNQAISGELNEALG
jgi:hypothetical protein